MASKRRNKVNWRDWLGLIPVSVFVFIVAFVVTKHEWFDGISADNKALFWTSLITALATLGLFVVAVVAAVVAYYQFREFQRGAKVQTTTDLLQEWSKGKYQRIMGFIDYGPSPVWCRKSMRLLYRFVYSDEYRPADRKKRLEWRERQRIVHDAIQDISLMATRTWNLLEHGIIDEDVLFGQLDYDIVSTYYDIETVLAIRQYEDDLLYSEFTWLAQRAQRHYRKRPGRETVPEFRERPFRTLPFEEDEFEQYMRGILSEERIEREDDLQEELPLESLP